jgi:hypothetical protein
MFFLYKQKSHIEKGTIAQCEPFSICEFQVLYVIESTSYHNTMHEVNYYGIMKDKMFLGVIRSEKKKQADFL